ncbi:MAG: hypothetical protein WA945_10130 [Arcobacteraceae bacterium]
MNISQQLEKNKIKIIQESIENYKNKGRGLSTALKYMTRDIIKMKNDNISLTQQVILLESVLNVKIKYDTYKKWYRRWINNSKKNLSVEVEEFQQQSVNKSAKNQNKKVILSNNRSSNGSIQNNTSKVYHNPVANIKDLI